MLKKILFCSLLLTACGGSDKGPTIYEVTTDYAIETCDYLVDCGLVQLDEYYQCVDLVMYYACGERACSQTEEWRGDPDRLDACLYALQTASCANTDTPPPECENAL